LDGTAVIKGDIMDKTYRILVINPGSTSTKIAVYDGNEEAFAKVISHPTEQIMKFNKIYDQYDFRKQIVNWCLPIRPG
jgi:butyrate kinase